MLYAVGARSGYRESSAYGGEYMEIELTDANFEQEVLKSDKPVLVDFWAPWCGPCQMMGPVIASLAEETKNAKVGKLNVDEYPATAQAYGIMSIPSLKIFKDGKIVKEFIGVQSKESLAAELAAL
jgi:thioredoxin 1